MDATVKAARLDGSYDVEYSDNDAIAEQVERRHIRLRPGMTCEGLILTQEQAEAGDIAAAHLRGELVVGDEVEASL